MSKLYIKDPSGRVIRCPRGLTKTEIVGGAPVIAVDEKSLKPGWSVASSADISAKAAENAAIEAQRAADAVAAKPENVIAAAIKADSVAPSAKKGS